MQTDVWENVEYCAHRRAFVRYCTRQGDDVVVRTLPSGYVDILVTRRHNMSQQQYANEGVVSVCSTKDWYDGKAGRNIQLYSFQIQGSNRWFRTGQNELPFREGDYVRFTNDAKGNVDVKAVQVGNPPAGGGNTPPPQTSGQSGSTGGSSPQSARSSGGQNRDGYWAQKEQRDIEKDQRYQAVDVPRMSFSASQDRAVNLVAAALAHDCLSFGNMKKGEKLDYVLDSVDKVTDRFFQQSMYAGERWAALRDGHPEMYTSEEVAEGEEGGYNYDE